MDRQILVELETAASVLMAPPNMVTSEQRHTAENTFLNFRKSTQPYELCRNILENSQNEYVLFEAAEVLKSALIREWGFLQENDIINLRQYLMQYVTMKQLPTFVRDRILQVIAIMVKRGSVEDFGIERSHILTEVENLIINGESTKKILGCKLITNLMQEYANTIKSTDVGLTWEVHFKAKKQFEATDLRRIFKFCVQALSEMVEMESPYSDDNAALMKQLLVITEGILTWGYISPILPKIIIGVYESVYEADQAPSLRLAAAWKDVMFAPRFLPLMFHLFWKLRNEDNLSYHVLSCLVQLASLNGNIMNNADMKLQYLQDYIQAFLNTLSNITLKDKEAIGFSNIIRKLVLFFPTDLVKLPQNIQETLLDQISQLSCTFAEGSALEESQSAEDKMYCEAFDNILEAWTSLLQNFSSFPKDLLQFCSQRIFNTYLQCHIASPDGKRSINLDDGEEIEENEENDRIKFKDQLQTIGVLGRIIPNHSLPILFHLLENRTEKLRECFLKMQSQPLTLNDSNALDNLFEDIHWIILIAGHVLCMESDGETPLIPAEIMQFSMEQNNNGESNLETSLKLMASVTNSTELIQNIDISDKAIRIAADVLKLCVIESFAAEVKLGHFMSPEVGCTLMWFLQRWCLSYLIPNENYYQEISPTIIGALGKDTEGASFMINYILSKIQSNICHFHSEPVLLQDSVNLFIALVHIKQKAIYILKSEGLWNIVDLESKLDTDILPQTVRRGLFQGFVLAGAALEDKIALNDYWQRLFKPLQVRFKSLLCQENFNRIYQEEAVQKEIIRILESFIGIVKGSQISTVKDLYDFISPNLSELPVLLNLYNNYQSIVQLILQLFGQCARHMLCYLSQEDSKTLYQSTLSMVQAYAKCNVNRFTLEASAEESSFQDLVLVMDLLTSVLSKDCIDLSPLLDSSSETGITASEVSLFGLNFIMPLMTMDLLKYPSLCLQYYRLVMLVNEIYPDKICSLSDDMLHKLLCSVHLGLTHFGPDVVMSCLDFLQVLATHVHRSNLKESKVYSELMPFLKFLMELILSHQINSDLLNTASTTLYSLICCYNEQYQSIVQELIRTQPDSAIAQRLAACFNQLSTNIQFNAERPSELKFRDNFSKFIADVHGFLLVK